MFVEDFRPFVNTADFADAVTINGATVNGFLDDQDIFEPIDGRTAEFQPMFTCPAAWLPTVAVGDAVVARGATYHVAEIRGLQGFDPFAVLLLTRS